MVTYTGLKDVKIDKINSYSGRSSGSISKRLFDIVAAIFIVFLVLLWMIPLVGLIIKFTSPGPVFFVQMRTGRHGRTFRCFKFRTMVHDRGKAFKQVTRNDPGITSIGRFLRKNNLDEMPQFLNVLLGDMSLVGPRPHAVDHDKAFWTSIPYYPNRYTVRPGITGLAQVRGARGLTETPKKMERRLRYDLHYIKNCSFLFDMLICWWTIKTMFQGDENAW
ncbi:sugar transferase [Larkinella sp. GY13]|uniref:sugar transferase n=1 Tax=Larkinella sp. GY13 TaxID=3453720 RepID=UPI003EEE40F4